MIGLQPQVNDYERLIQTEVLELLGISRNTLVSYEDRGIMPPGRRVGKYTYYTGRDVKRGWKNYYKQF